MNLNGSMVGAELEHICPVVSVVTNENTLGWWCGLTVVSFEEKMMLDVYSISCRMEGRPNNLFQMLDAAEENEVITGFRFFSKLHVRR